MALFGRSRRMGWHQIRGRSRSGGVALMGISRREVVTPSQGQIKESGGTNWQIKEGWVALIQGPIKEILDDNKLGAD